jgi:hypothetical protein
MYRSPSPIFIFIVAFSSLAWFVCKAILPETLQPEKRQPLHPLYLGRMYWSVATSPRFIAASLALTFNFSGIFIYMFSLFSACNLEKNTFLHLVALIDDPHT